MTRELALPGRVVFGVDLSLDELRRAAHQAQAPWLVGDARQLPIGSESVDAVTSAMGLSVVVPQPQFVSEVARVLKPGGVFAALVPTMAPANAAELRLASQLSWVLRAVLRFPGALGVNYGKLLSAAGLTKVEDQRERYRYAVRSRADAELLFAAIDHTGVSDERVEAAIDFLGERTLSRGVVTLAIPMRRIVAIK